MVQFIDIGEDPSVRIGQQLGGLVKEGFEGFQKGRETAANEREIKSFEQEFGTKISRNPDIQKIQISELLKGKMQKEMNEQKTGINSEEDQRIYSTIENEFGTEAADLYSAATPGGKTKFLDHLLRAKKRGEKFDLKYGDNFETPEEEPESFEDIEEPESKISNFNKELKEHLLKQDEGLLPEEKIRRGEKRYDTNLKFYQEAGTKLRAFAADRDRFNVLESINTSDKLPKNLGRLNVDTEGNLRAPFLANAETQRFIKTLNEFSQNAKDTFGSRVTNFDLAQYLKRFPTALNTKEGRRQILQQMRLVNQINSVYYKNLKNVYDKAGGVRNIDADAAERFAERISEPKIAAISEKFKEIGQFSSKPSAEEFPGKKIRDTKTGEVLISNGADWIPENQENENAL